MKILGSLAVGVALFTVAAVPCPAQKPANPTKSPKELSGYEVVKPFTAQKRPRVAVLDFEDTNKNAEDTGYGDSVEAMLMTFLKRKSQFVVVERKQLRGMEEEKQLIGHGGVQLDPGESRARDLLERLDTTIYGNVTLLDNVQSGVKTAATVRVEVASGDKGSAAGSQGAPSKTVQGQRIEIDAKLISRFDGRIIAVAQRSGPVACLRSIVERLGTALEQEFLRPYYGKLRFELKEPGYVRIHLTPILLDTARTEEIPPAERSISVTIGSEQDKVRSWVTDPISYTVDNLLTGWYSMRLERPGFASQGADNSQWVAHESFANKFSIKPKKNADPADRQYLVEIKSLQTLVVEKAPADFALRRLSGSFSVKAMRQYLDSGYSHAPARVMLVGGKGLEINRIEKPLEYADDADCDLFNEEPPNSPPYALRHVRNGEAFDVSSFAGGELIIENYRGEYSIPVGTYEVIAWEPSYRPRKFNYTVYEGDQKKVFEIPLDRETLPAKVDSSGPSPRSKGILVGRETGHRFELSLGSSFPMDLPNIPMDTYSATTDIPGLRGWRESFDLHSVATLPPSYEEGSPHWEPKILGLEPASEESNTQPRVKFKTRLVVGGRLDALSRQPDPVAADLDIDSELSSILDRLLSNRGEQTRVRRGFWKRVLRRAEAPKTEAKPSTDAGSLRAELASHLRELDLLVLDARDMSGLESSLEAQELVARWVAGGGTLFGFVSSEGDYSGVVGAPLDIKSLARRTRRFELFPGEVDARLPSFQKKVKVKSKRALPELSTATPEGSWRVLAYTKAHQAPRIVERTSPESGGHVLLWLDDPRTFVGPLGGTVPKVEEVRKRVEEQAFKWARYGMYRRYDLEGENLRRAEESLPH